METGYNNVAHVGQCVYFCYSAYHCYICRSSSCLLFYSQISSVRLILQSPSRFVWMLHLAAGNVIFPFVPFMIHDFFPSLQKSELGKCVCGRGRDDSLWLLMQFPSRFLCWVSRQCISFGFFYRKPSCMFESNSLDVVKIVISVCFCLSFSVCFVSCSLMLAVHPSARLPVCL